MEIAGVAIDEDLWRKFSQIQFAEYLIQNEENIARFREWLNTKDNDVWS